MVEIYIIRHGKTEMNEKQLIIGHLDSPLLKSSEYKIKKLSEKLKKIKFDAIYSSKLGRANQTAKIIAENLDYTRKIRLSEELQEIDYGILADQSKDETKKRYPQYHNDINFINPGGESFKQLYSRIVDFLEKIKDKHKRILIVTHAGCMRAIYSYCNNEDFQDNINLKLGHNSILKCVIDDKNKKFCKFL